MGLEITNLVIGLPEDTSPDILADYVMVYDASNLALRKIKLFRIVPDGTITTSKLGGDITTAGKAILDDVDAAAQRTTLSAAKSGANTDISSLYLSRDGIKLKDTDASHGLTLVYGTNLTADRNFSIKTADANVELIMNGDMTVNADGSVTKAAGLFIAVRNESGSQIAQGSPVYISGYSNGKPLITLATASTEVGSSKTLGVVTSAIANNSNGQAIVYGELIGTTAVPFNTSAYTAGTKLWLGTTAGSVTTTRPSPPDHAVFLGTVVKSDVTEGVVVYQIQNGYELEELHNTLFTSLQSNDVLYYDSATSLWKNAKVGTSFLGGDITTAGKNLLDDADASAQRTTLGLGTISTQAANNVAITGGTISGVSQLSSSGAVSDQYGDLRTLPENAKTGAYNLAATDTGRLITTTSGNVTVNSGIFSVGQAVTIYNNSSGNISIVQGSSVTLRLAGSATTGTRTLAQYGVATVLCVASNVFAVSGSGLT